jgi:uncharacterized membrane protein HdeD (DUF308 family)
MSESTVAGSLKRVSGWAIAWAVLVILAGVVAISLPLISGIGVTIVVGWLLVISGILHLVESFEARGAGAFFWRLLVGIIYVIGGFDIAIHPTFGLITLTLVLGIILIVQGLIAIGGFFGHRRLPGSGWILLNGIIALLLGLLIWWDGPRAAVWVIGTLVGVNLIFSGVTRLMMWGAVHRSLSA